MQRMRFWWSALSRRILLYFCTLLIPVLILFLLFYRQAFTASLEDLSEKIVLNMGTTVERVDISITTMQKASMMLLNDMRVRKYVKPIRECTAEDRIQQIDVFSTIGALANIGASNLVETMFLYLDDQHVFSDGLYAFDQYFTRLFQFEAYGPEFWTNLLAEKNSHWGMLPATTLKISPTNLSRRVVPSYVSSTVTGRRMLVVTVYSVPKLLEVLRSDAILPEMRTVIVGEDGSPVLSMLAESQTQEALAAIAQAGGADVFKTELDGAAYRVLRQKSQASGWSYFAFVPMHAFSANARSLLILQGLSLGMLGLGLLLSVYYTYRICRPIRRIRATLESGYRNAEVDGSRDDVAVIHQKLNSLLLDYEEAREERLSIMEEFLQSGMLQLLSGHTEHRLPRMLALLRRSYSFAGASYRCALLHVHLAEGIEKTLQDTQRLNLLSNMRADLSALIGQRIPCYVLEHRESQYLCVLCDEDLSGARVRAVFEEILE
nr:hypothetical protein [Clostridia bacterium]